MVNGSNAGSASDESDVWERIGFPLVAFHGGEKEERLAGLEVVQVGAGFAVGVVLYHEIEMALFICGNLVSRCNGDAIEGDDLPVALIGVYGLATGIQLPSGHDIVNIEATSS